MFKKQDLKENGGGQLPVCSAAKAASVSPLCNSGRMWVITGKGGKGCWISAGNDCNFGVFKSFMKISSLHLACLRILSVSVHSWVGREFQVITGRLHLGFTWPTHSLNRIRTTDISSYTECFQRSNKFMYINLDTGIVSTQCILDVLIPSLAT